jgi:hypothetical protein
MLLWSVVPEEYVWEGYEKMECKWREAEVDGVKMIVEPCDPPGYGRIVRLLSPDPRVYLKPDMQPGQLVCLMRKQG